MTGQLRLPTKNYPSRLRAFTPFAGSCPYQLTLKLGKTAKDC